MTPSIVLITGCSSGIGLATAVRLAKDPEQKYKVYATVISLDLKDRLEAAAGDALDKTLLVRPLDVTKDDTIRALVDDVVREDGKIDILVNNAGIFDVNAITHKSMEWCQELMDINFWGVVRLTRAVLPTMQDQSSGKIINVSSTSGIIGVPFFDMYSASKFAMEGYTESIAPVLRDAFNIRVSLIEPRGVRTDLIVNFAKVPITEQARGFGEALRPLYVNLMKEMSKEGARQRTEELARLVQEIAEAPDPHLRYQSNEGARQIVCEKFTDPTGDSYLPSLK